MATFGDTCQIPGDKMGCHLHQAAQKYWTAPNIYNFVLSFSWIIFLWGCYLSYRQYRVYVRSKKVPDELTEHLDQETMDKARLYSIDKARYGLVYSIWSQLITTALFVFNAIPYGWNLSGQLLLLVGIKTVTEIPQTLAFLIISSLFSLLLDLPWNIYYTFVLEAKHGFNKYTFGFYLADKLKKFFVLNAISLPITAAAIQIITIGGPYFFIYLWAFCSFVVLLLATIYPDYIAPLFDKYVPLPDSSIKTKIEDLASTLKYPLRQIYIVEGSKRSSHSNAYLYGMFNRKKIVLFDTLIDRSVLDLSNIFQTTKYKESSEKDKPEEDKQKLLNENEQSDGGDANKSSEKEQSKVEGCNEEEILAVLAHELGHWKLNHILKNMFISEINMLIIFFLFAMLHRDPEIYMAFGFFDQMPIFIGLLIIFEYIFSPYNEICSFFMTCLSRRFEFQADAFGKQLGRAEHLKKALIKLNKTNLSFPINDWLYSACNHSHPPLLERINALGKTE